MADLGAELLITEITHGLHLQGEIDAHTTPRLGEALAPFVVAGGQPVRIDMSAVTFMDSSGLRVIVSSTSEARSSGGDIVLVSPTPAVTRVIEISGLTDHLTIDPG
jgi:anti-sigma B factor antagonist